ncbi:MAG: transketolase [Candidatus Niyogibacteria bacterium RIFCSPLOWO2_01_FULL_45_48]|uniref:Transketolase n=2 Tax=Candidatus Niyogiibacteriota TaxID=1817912 RepID=A0A1G2F0Q5_9BACT|nr:MAG: transketolase [Candidatus Niyogibacteria bacterium RIFCSPLOWO2_01_FULL_45_48]OGZ30629.1 MAG: transketolase [Candidatus Niyogibacteria bacterium RIFCSPHIGHO2_01_FULL_45_28]OGZ31666.1 MAG: transketolase [Candidatus Niyogibacteria bacterium RIFCSPLOWO2_02_FULL_45_13]
MDLKKVGQAPTRNGYGEGLVEAGRKDKNVVVLCADLTESTRSEAFAKEFPERFVQMGVAEQNMASVASGMAAVGKIPFISSYAMFSPGRNWEQIRTTICYNERHVIIGGAHAGVSVGPDGATHQAIEDIAITRVLPNMTVIVPCDAVEAKKATVASVGLKGAVYLRFAREKTPVFTTDKTPFKVGRAEILWDSSGSPSLRSGRSRLDVAVIACGPLVHNALLAAADLEKKGIKVRVINNHTIKPMDEKTILKAAKDAGALVTVEEHQINGGMGSAVAEIITRNYPVPIEFVGVKNRFGESGEPTELIEHFGMSSKHIIEAARRAIKRK